MGDEKQDAMEAPGPRSSVNSSRSSRSGVVYRDRNRNFNMWRPSSYLNAARHRRIRSGSSASTDPCDQNSTTDYIKKVRNKLRWTTLVNVMVVQAKGLPQTSEGSPVCCKIRLGSESYKTKSVSRSQQQPQWREQFQMHIYRDQMLKISVWEKGKQKNFMGSCVVDLTRLKKEKTHELYQELDDGFGEIHLYVTLCTIRGRLPAPIEEITEMEISKNKQYAWSNVQEALLGDEKRVGELRVRVVAARGLPGRPRAYCTLELGNQRVQTDTCRASCEPVWDKQYMLDVSDVTSTLDVSIHESSLRSSFRNEILGAVSIPLFRIANEETRWYALKDATKRNSARGNYPRVLLQTSITYNTTKAALKVFSPKEIKYLEKPKKLSVDLVYKNTVFIKELFDFLHFLNHSYMHLFEWDNHDVSVLVLVGWLLFWYYFKPWTLPLFLLVPFAFHLLCGRNMGDKTLETSYRKDDGKLLNTSERHDVNFKGKLQALPDIASNIIANIELLVSFAERMYNLATFKVPFLSYIAILVLAVSSLVMYSIPFNYLPMGLGLYKFTRKFLNPHRKLNNDVVDFISRIPDNEIWKDWKELSVPEPLQSDSHNTLTRSISDSNSNVETELT